MAKATPRVFLTLLYLSAAALAFLPAANAAAEETEKTESTVLEDCSVPMSQPVFTSGMRVWIDPETGKIRQPTDEERRAHAEKFSLDSLLNRSSEGLVVVTKPDGAKYVDLQGRFMHALVVKRSKDGTLIAKCIDGEDHTHNDKTRNAAEEPPLR